MGRLYLSVLELQARQAPTMDTTTHTGPMGRVQQPTPTELVEATALHGPATATS